MVRLFRGIGGRGAPRHPFSFPRPMRPPREFEPGFIQPYGPPRGRLFRGNIRHGPPHSRLPPPPRLPPSPSARPLPLPPHQPVNHRELYMPPIPRRPLPIHNPMNHPGIPPPMHPLPAGPPLQRPLGVGPPFVRGRGGVARRGIGLKRLFATNGRPRDTRNPLKRKQKKEGDFYCETCDRSWNTLEKLEEHVSQHEVCGRDGCLFTGHPKVVQKHVELQHDTGLYKRILNDNPNDIAKWIAERKSRFPTKENVQKKEAQEKEMMNRGESIPSQGKRFPNRKSWNNRGRNMNHSANSLNRGGGGPRQSRPAPKHVKMDSDSKWRDPDTWRGDLPKFPGTAAVTLSEEENEKNSKENGNFSDDEEWTVKAVDNSTPSNADKPIVSNVLTLLMSSYGSDMSEEDDAGTTEGSSRIDSVLSLNDVKEKSDPSTSQNGGECLVKSKSEKDLADGTSEMDQESDSGPEESAIEREDKSNIPFIRLSEKECTSQLDNTNSRQPSSRPKAPLMRPVTRRYQLSLLEKLLSSEIRKERNAILQCVRYVVTNDFFGCGNLGKATVNS